MKLDYTRIIGLVVVGISITVIFGTMLPQNDMDHSENLSEPITENSNPLIVMVAPSIHEKYYKEVFQEVIDYDVMAVNAMYGKDDIILLADKATIGYFEGRVPDEVLVTSNVVDIWIRDFGTVNTTTEVKFEYRPQYLSVSESDWIDESYEDWFSARKLTSKKTDLILDGGNLVFNGQDKAITSVRVFADNPQYSQDEIDQMLKELLEVTEIAYLMEW